MVGKHSQDTKDKMRKAALRRGRIAKQTAARLAAYEARYGKLTLAELRKP